MLFCQVWIARRATRYNLAKPQTFPLEKPRGSNSGLRCSLVFWMSLYKDYELGAGGPVHLFEMDLTCLPVYVVKPAGARGKY